MRDNSKVALAGLIGAIVGAGVALLLAPASGKETRDMIAEKIDDVKDEAKKKVKEAGEKVKKVVKEATA